jgi:hypothetical protein
VSFNVLVIAEDFTKDQHILKPVVEQILLEAGKPNAKVETCLDPRFQGISECLKVNRLRNEVLRRYPMIDLFLLIVDRDGHDNRAAELEHVATQLKPDLRGRQMFLAEMVRQEVEILLIAGHRLERSWKWKEIREDAHIKDTYFKQLVEREGTGLGPHEGRKELMKSAMGNWSRICRRCPEETTGLAERIRLGLS